MLNRTALILRPKQPYIDWVGSIESDGITPDINDELTVYLVPEVDSPSDLDKVLNRAYTELFERELEGWYLDQSIWPKNRTLKLFKEWFAIEYHTMVTDLCGYELVDDEIEA